MKILFFAAITLVFTACSVNKNLVEANEYNQFNANGKKEGKWIEIDSTTSDTLAYHTYKNGVLNGPFSKKFEGMKLVFQAVSSKKGNFSRPQKEVFTIHGNYFNDSLHGEYQEFYGSGKLYMQGNYANGELTGLFEIFYENGEKSFAQNYKDNALNGEWKQFYNSGKLKEQREFKNDEILNSSSYEWYDNGQLKNSSNYIRVNKKKVSHGPFVSYYENGNLELESFFKNDKPSDVWKGYYENGNIKYIMTYKDGIFLSNETYDENGVKVE